MRYEVFYWFSASGTSFGGSEEVCAKTPDAAVGKVRELHPHARLRISTIREREGQYAGRKLKLSTLNPSKEN